MMLEAALEILSCLFLKETGCREETWLPRIRGDGDFLGNNILSGCSPWWICLQGSGATGLSRDLVSSAQFCMDKISTLSDWLCKCSLVIE